MLNSVKKLIGSDLLLDILHLHVKVEDTLRDVACTVKEIRNVLQRAEMRTKEERGRAYLTVTGYLKEGPAAKSGLYKTTLEVGDIPEGGTRDYSLSRNWRQLLSVEVSEGHAISDVRQGNECLGDWLQPDVCTSIVWEKPVGRYEDGLIFMVHVKDTSS